MTQSSHCPMICNGPDAWDGGNRTDRCRRTFGHSGTLDAVRPLLTGLIRAHAERAAHSDEPMEAMPF
jgi:hypothetical protein